MHNPTALIVPIGPVHQNIDRAIETGEQLKRMVETLPHQISKLERMRGQIDNWFTSVHRLLHNSFSDPIFADQLSNSVSYKQLHLRGFSINDIEQASENASAQIERICGFLDHLKHDTIAMPFMSPSHGEDQTDQTNKPKDTNLDSVFVVHGHDNEMKESVARVISRLGLNPVILHEQPDLNQTIIEKFERHSDRAGFAVVLFSPDDEGMPRIPLDNGDQRPMQQRPRQNVVLELGYFLGKLGRDKVSVIRRGDLENPSDYSGVLYTPYDEQQAWKFQLAQNLKAVGYQVDANKLLK